jgi:hypothetical protein
MISTAFNTDPYKPFDIETASSLSWSALVAEVNEVSALAEPSSQPPNFSSLVGLAGAALSRMVTHVLFESASGYAIFEAKLHASIESRTKDIQSSIDDLSKFGKMVSLVSFSPFKTAAHALENANDVSEGAKPCRGTWHTLMNCVNRIRCCE